MARPRKFERDVLLEKALELFWEKGFEATSTQDLVTRLGIHPGSLFGTFGDKRTLFYEAFARYEERVREILFSGLSESIPRRQALATVFERSIAFLLAERANGRRGCFMINEMVELGPLDPQMDEHARIHLARLEKVLLQTLSTATENGEIRQRPDEELRELARSLMASLLSIRLLARMGAEEAVLRDVARAALRTVDT